jgi:hypothetical protein
VEQFRGVLSGEADQVLIAVVLEEDKEGEA